MGHGRPGTGQSALQGQPGGTCAPSYRPTISSIPFIEIRELFLDDNRVVGEASILHLLVAQHFSTTPAHIVTWF